MKIVIPAREGSKGFPHKNRKLLTHTLKIIPKHMLENTYVSTDDEHIKSKLPPQVKIHHRSEKVSNDTASTLSTMQEFVKDCNIEGDVAMLYLTYPERKWEHVAAAYEQFKSTGSSSLLCKKELDVHPYLMMYDAGQNKGKQIVEHNLYRRQDYPACFEISHYVSIFNTKELNKLNNNMYNENTYFFEIDNVTDVDYEEDLKKVSLWL
jgi:CMP-N-acetylneuraminic acid synthetase